MAKQTEPVTFAPDLRAADACANYWLRQATIRLRREICWCWHERGLQPPHEPALLPPYADKLSTTLDLTRFWAEKQDFYLTDPTARYLSEQLDRKKSLRTRNRRAAAGSFGWVVETLALDDAAAFVLALSLAAAFDANMGSVIAACLNDQMRTQPNLALAQKLWDEPDEVLRLADAGHPLFRYGLLKHGGQSGRYFAETNWDAPLTVPALVAAQLLFPQTPLPHGLVPLDAADADASDAELSETARVVALRLSACDASALRVVPVLGAKGAARRETVRAIARAHGKALVEFAGDAGALEDGAYLNALAAVCWLRACYLFFSQELTTTTPVERQHGERGALPATTIPATLFVAVNERSQLSHVPAHVLLPAVQVAPATYHERLACWQKNLGKRAKALRPIVAECARRFRFERATIRAVCVALRELPGELRAADLLAACRAEVNADIGE